MEPWQVVVWVLFVAAMVIILAAYIGGTIHKGTLDRAPLTPSEE